MLHHPLTLFRISMCKCCLGLRPGAVSVTSNSLSPLQAVVPQVRETQQKWLTPFSQPAGQNTADLRDWVTWTLITTIYQLPLGGAARLRRAFRPGYRCVWISLHLSDPVWTNSGSIYPLVSRENIAHTALTTAKCQEISFLLKNKCKHRIHRASVRPADGISVHTRKKRWPIFSRSCTSLVP